MSVTKITSKMIVIKYHGPIAIKGGIYGPTLPYREDIHVIASLLTRRYPVFEQLVDGTEIELTLLNYKEDHNSGKSKVVEFKEPVADPDPIPPQEPVVDGAGANKGQQNGNNKQDNKSGNSQQQNGNKSGGNQSGTQNNQSGKLQVNSAKDNNINKADELTAK